MSGTRSDDGEVVLAFDGSRESANAVARAGELLGPRPAAVITVWRSQAASLMLAAPLAGPPRQLADGEDPIAGPARDRAQRRAAEGTALAQAAGFEARPLALEATHNVWHALCDYAATNEVAVTVVGARGRSRVASVALGGVSTGLVEHTSSPVLVVPATAHQSDSGPVVFGYDGSANAGRAVSVGSHLLRRDGLVVSVWHPWTGAARYPALSPTTTASVHREVDRATESGTVAIAAEGSEIASAAGPEAAPLAAQCDGTTWRGLLDSANQHGAVAIVVGSRGVTGVARTLGSVSGAIVHHSPRPVLVVPPLA